MSTDIDEPNELPVYSRDLIALLDRTFPPRCMHIDESADQHHRYAGVRSLIDGLKEILAEEDATNGSS